MATTKLMESTVKTFTPQFGQILIGDDRSRSLSSVYFANPSPLEERNFGHLFMVLDIQNSEHENNKKILSFLEQELRHGYYYSEHFSVEEAFEQALQETNQKIQSLAAELPEGWMRQLNILVGVLKGQELILSHSGSIHAFLVQNDRILDIIDQRTGTEMQNPARLFGNMVSGEISPKNVLMFCTPSFLDYFSLEKIKKTVEGPSVEQSTDHLVQLLSENENQDSFGAILLRLKSANAESPNIEAPSGSSVLQRLNQEIAQRAEIDSMHQLVHKEQATSELLTPSLWPIVKKNLIQLTHNSQRLLRERLFRSAVPLHPRAMDQQRNDRDPLAAPILPSTPPSPLTQRSRSWSTVALHLISQLLKGLKWIGIKLITLLVYGGRMLFQMVDRRGRTRVRSQVQRLPTQAGNLFSRFLTRLKGLSRPRKILLALSLVFLFLFAQSIINLGERNEAAGEKAEWEQNIEKARVNLVEAEAAMNYDNNEGALSFLSTASDLLASIPAQAAGVNEQKQELTQKIRQLQGQINKITVIDQPALFSDLTRIHPNIEVSHLQFSGSSLLGFDANNGSIYSIGENPETTLASAAALPKIRFMTSDEQGRNILLRDDGTISRVQGSTESQLKVVFTNQDRDLIAISYFAPGRLYTLDRKNKQIFKHTSTPEGFGTGMPWLTDPSVQLDNITSMTVDGSIYLLNGSGEVIKLFGGQKQEITIDAVEPALSGATKIFTSETSTGLYVLDPNNKRVVVFDKQGKVRAQYVSDAFDHLIDLAVREDQNQLFVLNGQNVFKIDLSAPAS